MKVTKEHEAKSIERQVLGDRDVKWGVAWAWKGRWRREILLTQNFAVVEYRRVGAVANTVVIPTDYKYARREQLEELQLWQRDRTVTSTKIYHQEGARNREAMG